MAFSLTLVPLVQANDDEDADKMLQQAMEQANKAAAQAGIKVPDVSKQLSEMEADNEKEDKAEASAAKTEVHRPAVSSPLLVLPDWIPVIPEFHAAPKATKKEEDGVETGNMKGTSSLSPEAIAENWHTTATARKLSFERQNSNINGKKSVHVRISDLNGTGGEATLELVPGKNTSVEVDYKFKPTSPPASQ